MNYREPSTVGMIPASTDYVYITLFCCVRILLNQPGFHVTEFVRVIWSQLEITKSTCTDLRIWKFSGHPKEATNTVTGWPGDVFPEHDINDWVVVSSILYIHPYLGKIPILTNIFQRGWNHQLDDLCKFLCVFCLAFLPHIQCWKAIVRCRMMSEIFPMSKELDEPPNKAQNETIPSHHRRYDM